LIVGGVGYGFYGGAKTKAFASKSADLLAASENKWQVDQLSEPGKDMSSAELKTYFTKVKDDCDSALSQIQNQGSTAKTKTLKQNDIDYYTLGQKASGNGLIILNYMDLMTQIGDDMNKVSINASGTEALKTQVQQMKGTVDKDLGLLKGAKTTPSIEKLNQEMISGFTNMSKSLGDAIAAIDANHPEQVGQIMNSFSTAAGQFNKLSMPTGETLKNDILTSSEQSEMKDLATNINNETNQLKNTVFAF